MSKKSNKKLHIICLAAFAVLLCAAMLLCLLPPLFFFTRYVSRNTCPAFSRAR